MKTFKVVAVSSKVFKMEVEAPDWHEAMKVADNQPMDEWKEIYEDSSWEIVDAEEIGEDEEED